MVPELRSAFAGKAKSVSQAPSLRKREPVKLSIGFDVARDDSQFDGLQLAGTPRCENS